MKRTWFTRFVVISLLGILLLGAFSPFSAIADGISVSSADMKAILNQPNAKNIVLDSKGRIDNDYYIKLQEKLIKKCEKTLKKQIKSGEVMEIGLENRSKAFYTNSTRPGDVYVTIYNDIFGKSKILVGHASLVKTNGGKQTVTSYPSGGVQIKTDEWTYKRKYYARRVSWTNYNNPDKAVKCAERYIGKGYNWVYVWKARTDKFYCSQLVWRAWIDAAGVNIDAFPYDTWVAPVELVLSPRMYTLYYVK